MTYFTDPPQKVNSVKNNNSELDTKSYSHNTGYTKGSNSHITISLADTASSIDDHYNGYVIEILSGPGENEAKLIILYISKRYKIHQKMCVCMYWIKIHHNLDISLSILQR